MFVVNDGDVGDIVLLHPQSLKLLSGGPVLSLVPGFIHSSLRQVFIEYLLGG